MPRRVKNEPPDEAELSRAADSVMSYQDRLDDWRRLENSEKATLLKFAFMTQDEWKCLSSTCNKRFVSAPGLQYHLDRCGFPKKRLGIEVKPKQSKVKEGPELSKQGRKSLDTQVRSISDAIEKYLSYRDRLEDWRKLTDYEQQHILRYVFKNGTKKTWACLSSSCSSEFSTPGGLVYHLQRCGVPVKERCTTCRLCGEVLPRMSMPQHRARVHGQEAMYITCVTPSTSRKKIKSGEIEEEATSDEEQSGANGDLELEEDSVTGIIGSPKRRRRAHLSLATSTFEEYQEYMRRVYETFKTEAFGGGRDELFKEELQQDWQKLDNEDIPVNIPRLSESIRMNIEGLHDEDEAQSLQRFETSKTDSGFIVFCGGAVSVASWCPIEAEGGDPVDQYILVAVNADAAVSISDDDRSGYLQLWRLDKDSAQFHLCYTITHEYGTIMDMKWCPTGQWIPAYSQLGAVAVTTAVGEVSIYVIHTMDKEGAGGKQPTVFQSSPHLRLFSGTNAAVYSLDWSPYKQHDEVVAAFADGTLCLWRLSARRNADMLDEDDRLLPVLCLDVANTPLRVVRWWSESKVVVASLDRTMSLWDLETTVCITRHSTHHLSAFACLGSYFPSVVYAIDSSQAVPSVSILDFICSAAKWTMAATTLHSSAVWPKLITYLPNIAHTAVLEREDMRVDQSARQKAISINPWTGETLTVDDMGTVCRSGAPVLDGIFESKRKKYVDEVVLKSGIQREGTTPVYDYPEAAKRCSTKFTFSNKPPTKEEAAKEFKEIGLSGEFALNALFTVAWNCNRNFSRWCCFGGQNGLLHVMNLDTKRYC